MQEVNAVTLAVEKLHPDVNSVIELGGQDAKIIIFCEADAEGKIEWTVSVDATIARAHQHATNTKRPEQDTGGFIELQEISVREG